MPPSRTGRRPRVVVFQARALPAELVYDGSQAILVDVIRHLGACGVDTTLYCGQPAGGPEDFELSPGVRVRSILPFGVGDADPYSAPPFQLAEAIDTLRRATEKCDVLYIHDSNLRFSPIAQDCPTVSAVCDLVYGHTLAGVLNFGRDRIIAVSDYLGECLREIFRRFRVLADDAIHVINTGFAAERFTPHDPDTTHSQLGISRDLIAILYPHRPEPAKGIYDVLRAVALLKTRLPVRYHARLRLLVPTRPGIHAAGRLPSTYADAQLYAAELGVADNLHFHDWIPRAKMPAYYSAGAATVCAGTFPEAFGNVHVESMLCGTPAITSRVAAHRSTVPDELTRKVDPGDVESIADHLAEIIARRERTGPCLNDYLRTKFSADRMLRCYERAILECRRGSAAPLADLPGALTDDTRISIAPWAAPLRSGYYNDYTGYCTDGTLLECISPIKRGCTVGALCQISRTRPADIERWLRAGLVVSDPVAVATLPPTRAPA